MHTGDRVKFVGVDDVFHGKLEGKTGVVAGAAYGDHKLKPNTDLDGEQYLYFQLDGEVGFYIIDKKNVVAGK